MYNLDTVRTLFEARKPGFSLPQALYNDPQIFAFDLQAIFGRSWLLATTEAELPRSGSYVSVTIGGCPLIIVRDRNGDIRAFHNSCRHRGAQICPEGKGKTNRLVCPYHRWTYDLSGQLVSATRMGDDFDATNYALNPVKCETAAGVVYVCLSQDAPDFTPFRQAIEPLLGPHNLASAKLAAEATLVEKGNWKLVMENARECYHCSTGHPELARSFPVAAKAYFDYGEDPHQAQYEARMAKLGLPIGPSDGDWWQAIRFPLNEGFQSMSMDGAPLVNRPMTDTGDLDIGSLRWALEPNNFCHAVGDYVLIFTAEPISPSETIVTAKWLVHGDAVEGVDYHIDALTELWNTTNLQDRDLVENNQRGVNGAGYRPGPYSEEAEVLVIRFIDWYCDKAREFLDKCAGSVVEAAN